MSEKLKDNNFIIGKCFFLFLVMVYLIITNQSDSMMNGFLYLTCALFLASSVALEVFKKYQYTIMILEVILLIIMFIWIDASCTLYLPFLIQDFMSRLKTNPGFYLFSYICLYQSRAPFMLVFCYTTFLIWFYYENYQIINPLRKTIDDNEQTELELKDNIDHTKDHYRNELSRQRLLFENRYLEDKSHLAQELHDKLGHNINGSTYQLEACKILMEEDPVRCREIIQNVINSLRTGMDEIRMVLRNERPDKTKLAIVQLNVLCQDCIDKYGINAQLQIDAKPHEIPEDLWEIILDNTFEAISNSLKYAQCKNITIEINSMNKLVRCCITDDGIGCNNIKDGMGLQGIRKRVRSVNGFLDINSDTGFQINMLLPLSAMKDSNKVEQKE